MQKITLAVSVSLIAIIASPVSAQVATGQGAATDGNAGQRPVEQQVEEQAPGAQVRNAEDGAPIDSDEIVVTATRQATLLSKIPIAMTAITQEGLRDAGITNARLLNDVVPNLRITENNDGVRISIRGVSSADGTEKGDPSAAFLLDGIYIARPQDTVGSFYDLERVEVLRGPQGTLYGRNTTAGVINVIAARPKARFEASGGGSIGNFGRRELYGMINVPVSESLGIRAAANYERLDNMIRLLDTSGGKLKPYRDILSGRLSFGGKIGDNFDFVIRGDYSNHKGSMLNVVPLSNFFTVPPGQNPVRVKLNNKERRSFPLPLAGPEGKDNRFWGIMGEFTYDFGPAQLTYLGSYRESHRDDDRNLLVFGAFTNPAYFTGDYKQQSHELRAAFGTGNPLHGQAGLYYFKEKSFIDLGLGSPLANFVGGPDAVNFAFPQGPTTAESKAAFGTLTYDITPELHVTGGIRYTKDKKSRNGETVLDFNSIANSFCGAIRCVLNENIAADSWTKTTWRAGVDYDSALGLIYASISTGYKAGGFNDGCLTGEGIGCARTLEELFFEPEELTAYEAGFKFRLASWARLNASIFHYDYSNLQLNTIVNIPVPSQRITNAGKAKVDGIELELILTPTPNDRVDLALNYTDARYASFNPAPTVSFKGEQLDHAPKWSGAVGYTHTFQLGNAGDIEANVRTRWSSGYVMSDLNALFFFRNPNFHKTDASLTYNAPGRRYFVQAFIKNIENELTLNQAQTGNAIGASFEEPRTYGVRAGFNF